MSVVAYMPYLLRLPGLIYKSDEMWKALKEAGETLRKEDLSAREKITLVALNCLYAGGQACEMGAGFFSKWVFVNIKVIIGGADVGRQVKREGMSKKTFKVGSYRMSDLLGVLAKSGSVPGAEALLSTLSVLAMITGNVLGSDMLMGGIRTGYDYMMSLFFGAGNEGLSEEQIQMYRSEIRKLKNLIQWEALQDIPSTFQQDEVLRSFICLMTNQPVRFVVVLQSEQDLELYFESSAVNAWIREKPNEAPEGWPHELFPLPMKSDYFRTCDVTQRIIDARLKCLSEGVEKGMETIFKHYPCLQES
jgi:hypothetical protein